MHQLSTFWNWLDVRRQRRRAETPLDCVAQLTLRKLEERQVLSVTAGVVQGVLDIHVTDANQIVTLSSDGHGNLVVDGSINGQDNQHLILDGAEISSIHITSDAAANQAVVFGGTQELNVSGHIAIDGGFAQILVDSDVEADGGINFTANQISIDGSGGLTSLDANIILVSSTDLSLNDGAFLLSSHHSIELYAQNTLTIGSSAWISTVGGSVIADAGASGSLSITGTIDVSALDAGQVGGTIHLLGNQVELNSGAHLLADGDAGGGSILIGGGFGGNDDSLHNALHTTVDEGVEIEANAISSGDGGQVVVWSDDTTSFRGSIHATGGLLSGDGGSVEISGASHLLVTGFADLTAVHGQTGTLLLDPGSVTIIHDTSPTPPTPAFDVYTDNWVNTQLLTADVVISTTASTNSLTQNLTVDSAAVISWNTTHSLTLTGTNSVVIDGTISNTAAAGTLIITGGTISINNAITMTSGTVTLNSTGAVSETGAGTITASGLELLGTGPYTLTNANNVVSLAGSTSGSISYKDTDGFAIGTVNTAGLTTSGNVTLHAGGAVTQSQKISALGLELLGTGPYTLTNANNDITTLAANTTNAVSFRDTNVLLVGTVNSTVGITTAGQNVSLQTGSSLTLNNLINAGVGNVTLNAAGAVTQGAGNTITAAGLELLGAGPFTLTDAGNDIGILAASTTGTISYRDTNGFSIGTVNTTVGISTGGNSLTLRAGAAVTQAQAISASGLELLGSVSYTLTNSANDITTLAANTTGTISYRDASGFAIGTVNSTTGVSTGGNNLTLEAAGAVTQSQSITATGLELLGSGPYTLTLSTNNVTTLAANTSGAISYRDTNALVVGTVNSTAGIVTGGNNLTVQTGGTLTISNSINVGAGNISLNSAGAVTQGSGKTITAAGLELLGAGPFTLADGGNDVTTLAANTTGAISYRDSSGFAIGTVNSTSGVNTGGTNLTLQSGGAVTQSQAITALGLELLGTGSYTLTNAANNVTTLAANTTASISYRDTNALSVGTVNSTIGITTGGNDIVLQTGGTLTLDNSINAGAGNATLNSSGAVSQGAGDTITAAGLELLGAGPFTLTDANNNVGSLAANTTGVISYRDLNGFSIGTVNSTNGIATGGNTLTLRSGGAVTQTQAISASGLELLGTGPYTLTNSGNDVTILAANTAGAVSYRDTNALVVGTVNTTIGVVTGGNNFSLQTGGTLTLSNSINAGAGNATLNSAGAVTQGAGNTITASGLELLGSGPFTLTDSGNDISTLAASTTGVISYRDANGFSVGTVNSTSGIATSGNNLTLRAGAAVTQTQAITASGLELLGSGPYTLTNANNDVSSLAASTTGAISYRDLNGFSIDTINTTTGISTGGNNLTLQSGGAVTQTQALAASTLELLGTGSYTLTNSANNVATLAVNTAGSVSYRDTNALSVGTVNTTVGITTGGNNLTLQTGGTLTLNNVIAAGAGNVTLNSAGAVTQGAGNSITAAGLELLGAGPFTLTDSANDVSTLAASTTGVISYRDATGFSIGTVNTTTGITTGGNNLTLQAGGAVTQTQTVTASGLELLGSGPYTLTNSGNDVATLAANTTGAISYRDTNALSIGTVNSIGVKTGGNNLSVQTGGTLTLNQKVIVGAGNVTLNSAGAVTQGAGNSITGAGLELLGSGPFTLTDSGNDVTTLAASTTGIVSYRDTNGFDVGTVNSTNGISTTGNNLTLQAGGAVTQSQSISASGMELLGSGGYTLTNSGNNISTLAVNATGAISYRDTDGFSIGTINSTIGISTGGNNLTLQSGGAVTQTQAITASGLELLGSGPFTLTNASNNVSTLAASTTGVISYRDTNGFSIGTVNSTVGVATGGNNLTLQSGSAVTQSQAISATGLELLGSGPYTLTNSGNDVATLAASTTGVISFRDTNGFSVGTVNATAGISTGGNNLTLQSGGAVTQSQAITASGLELLGTGPYTLTNVNNNVASLAANIDGKLSYTDTDAFSVATVGGTTGITTSATTSAGFDVILKSGGTLAITKGISAGTSGIVTLNTTSGGVTESVGAAITSNKLLLLGTGTFTLGQSNSVNFLAAQTTGAITFNTTAGLNVGTVTDSSANTATGITTVGGDVNVTAGDDLTVDQSINTTPGSGGAIHVTNATLNAALIAGAGNITLQGGGNDLIINSAQSSATTINYFAKRDIIIGASVTTTNASANINMTADSDANGTGGVQILSTGQVNSAGSVSLKGSDLAATGSADSVRIDADGANDQVVAVGDVTISNNAAAPAGAVMAIDGIIHSTTGNISITSKSTIQAQSSITADTGKVDFHSALVLTGDELVTAGGNVTFDQTVDGATSGNQVLTVNSSGTTTFSGVVGTVALKSLSTDAAGATTLNANVTTTGTQTYGDDVTLTANVTLNGSSLTFDQRVDSDATARSLNLNTTGSGTKTFEGLVGSVHALASLTTNSDGTTDLNGGTAGILSSVTTVGAQTYNDNVVLTDDATLTSTNSGNITFQGTVRDDGSLGTSSNLVINTAGTTRFNSAVGDGGNPITSLTTNSGGMTSINANITTDGAQHFGDAVILTSDATVASLSSGNISFDKTVDANSAGGQGLTVHTGGITTFTGAVGTVALKSLDTDATGSTRLNANVTTTGTQTFGDDVVLTNDVTITSTGIGAAGNITFSQTVNGAFGLIVTTAGNELFSGQVGNSNALTSLTTHSSVDTTFNGAVIVAGNVDLHMSALNLNATLSTTNSGTTTITNSGAALIAADITSAGALLFAGTGGITLSANLKTTDSAASISVNTSTVTLTGNRSLTTNSGSILLDRVLTNAASTNTLSLDAGTGQVTFDNNLGVNGTELAGLTILHAGNVQFSGVSATIDVVDVSITNSGTTTFDGTAAIDDVLTVQSGGGIVVNSSISAAGPGTAIDLKAGAITGNGSVTVTGNGSLLTTTGGSDILVQAGTTSGSIVLSTAASNITANNVVTLTASAGSITGLGTLTGATVQLSAATGINDGTVSAGGLKTNATSISADNTQAYAVNIANSNAALTTVTSLTTVGANLTFTQSGGGDLLFTGAITSGSGVVSGGNILLQNTVVDSNLTIGATAILSSAVGTGGSLTISGATLSATTSPVVGAGNITIQGGAADTIIGSDLSVNTTIQLSARRDVIVRSTVSATGANSNLIITADSDNDGVGGFWLDESAATDAKLVAGHNIQITGSDLSTTAGVADSIQIDADGVNVQVLAANDLTLTGKVIGGPTPTTNADVIVDGKMTATAGSLTMASAHLIQLGADQTAGTNVQFQQGVLLTNDVTVTSTGAGAVSFQSFVKDDGSGLTTSNLVVNTAGVTTFVGVVGGGANGALSSLTTDSPGTTVLTTDVTTAGIQVYGDSVKVAGNATLTSTGIGAAGNITFQSTLSDDGNGLTNSNLIVITAGTTRFNATVGGGANGALSSLTTDGPGATSVNADVTTSGNQIYGDNLTLTNSVTLNGANLTFAQKVDSDATPRALLINSSGGGITTFEGLVGSQNALASLTTNADGTTDFNGGTAGGLSNSVTTVGAQTYFDNVILTDDATLTSTGAGNIQFQGTVRDDGSTLTSSNLVVNTSGTTRFNGVVGGGVNGAITSLTTDAPGTTSLNGNVTTVASQHFSDAVVLTGGIALTSTGNGNITFDKTIDGTTDFAQNLSLDTGSGNISIVGAIGGTTKLGDLKIVAAGDSTLTAAVFVNSFQQLATTAGGTTTFQGPVTTYGTIASSTDGFQFTGHALAFTPGTSSLEANGHDITLTADVLTLPTTFTNAINATVTIQTLTATTTIGVNSATQTLNMTDLQLDSIHAASVIIGSSTQTGGIRIGTDGAVTQDKNFTFRTAGTVQVDGSFSLDAAHTLLMQIGTDLNILSAGQLKTDSGQMTINAGNNASIAGQLTTTSAPLVMSVGHDLSLAATALIQSTTGDLTMTAGTAGPLSSGALTMANGAVVNAGSGHILLAANDNVTLGQVITTNNSATAVQITSTRAAIVDGGDAGTANIVAESNGAVVTLHAVKGIGSQSGLAADAAIETSVSQLDVVNASNLSVNAAGDIRLNEVSTSGVSIRQIDQQGSGQVVVHSAGSITVLGAASSGTGVHSRSGDLLLSAEGVASDLTLNSAVNTTGGAITLLADHSVFIAQSAPIQSQNGNVIVSADAQHAATGSSGQLFMQDGAVLTAGSGAISLHADNDVTLGRIVTTNATVAAVSIVSSSGSLVDGGDSTGENIVANSSGALTTINTRVGVGSQTGSGADAAIEVQIDTLQLVNGNSGSPLPAGATTNVSIVETDGIKIQQLAQANGGTVNVVSHGVMQAVAGQPGITSTTGQITLTALGPQGDVIVNSQVATTGAGITISADRDMRMGSASQVASSGGLILITAGTAVDQAGELFMADGASIFSSTGNIRLTADQNVTLGHVEAATNGLTLIAITSHHGGVVDGGDLGTTDVTGSNLVIRSSTGIGSGNALETNVKLLSIVNSAAGHVQIDNQSGQLLTIGAADGINGISNTGPGLGNIVITNNASILVSDVSSATNAPIVNSSGGGITLQTSPGAFDITINSPLAATGGSGNITLKAGQDVVVHDTQVAYDISVAGNGTVFLNAGRNVILGSQDPNTTPDNIQHTVPNDVIVHTATGNITNTLPLVYNIQSPQMDAAGDVFLSMDIGRPGESNITVTVYWGDGTSTTQTFAGPTHYTFQHNYTKNPNPDDQSAPILVNVQVAHDQHVVMTAQNVNTMTESFPNEGVDNPPPVPAQNINTGLSSAIYDPLNPNYAALHDTPLNDKIVSAGGTIEAPGTVVFQDITVRATSIPVPGEGAHTFPFDTTPPVNYLHFPERIVMPDIHESAVAALVQVDTLRLDIANAQDAIPTERVVFLEILNADRTVEKIQLDENVLDDLAAVISKLPDGRYRFQLQEPGESRQRLLLDAFEVRQGKIVDANDSGDRPATQPKKMPMPAGGVDAPADAPADAEEAIRNAHQDVSAMGFESLETQFVGSDTDDATTELPVQSESAAPNRWSSVHGRQAWLRAERMVSDQVNGFEMRAMPQSTDAESPEEARADAGDGSDITVALVGATMGVASLAHTQAVRGTEMPAGLNRGARLLRKYAIRDK